MNGIVIINSIEFEGTYFISLDSFFIKYLECKINVPYWFYNFWCNKYFWVIAVVLSKGKPFWKYFLKDQNKNYYYIFNVNKLYT